ncbi:MAG: AI-2E family transporter [Polyangiaceae bacterium]|jgi:predicted PurR-regulated permease PerM
MKAPAPEDGGDAHPGPRDSAHLRARRVTEHYAPAESRALGIIAILATATILWVLLPVGIGIVVGGLMALTLHPTARALTRRTHRPVLVALGLTVGSAVVLGGVVGALVGLLVLRGVSVLSGLPADVAPGGRVDVFLQGLSRPLAPLHVDPETLVDHLRGALGSVTSHVAGWAAEIFAIAGDVFITVFFMAITMYFVLRNWPALARRAEHLMPINPHHTRRLMREVQRLGRTVVIGNFGTALIQGLLAGIGFWIGHVPQPAFFGAVTGVMSLVPAFGTMLVWLPVGVILIAVGHPGSGVFELAWGALVVVAFCDYVVRPHLLGRGETMSSWMTFVALFGGIKLFGVVGLLLGPLFVGVAITALRVYERTRRFRLGLS